MALKLPDSAVPMGDFPVAKAVDIDFNDGENLQEKLDNGKIGGAGGGASTASEVSYSNEALSSVSDVKMALDTIVDDKADKSYVDDNFATIDKVDHGYVKILKNTDTDADEGLFISYKNRDSFGLRIYKNDNSEHELKFNTSGIYYVKNGVKVCGTSVANVGTTTITPASSNITGTIKYTVKNGTCYVSFKSVQATSVGTFSISTTMPKPDISCSIAIISDVSNYFTGCAYIDENTTQLKAIFYNTNQVGSCSFSYPVAE